MTIERNNMPGENGSPDLGPQVPEIHIEPNVGKVTEFPQPKGLLARFTAINGMFHREPQAQVLVSPDKQSPRAENTRPVEPIQSTNEDLLKLPIKERFRYVETLPEDQKLEAIRSLNLEMRGGAIMAPKNLAINLIRINTLSADEMEISANVEAYADNCEQLDIYANAKKTLDENNEITDLRKQLIASDEAYINSRVYTNPALADAEKKALRQLLNNLDAAELDKQRFETTLQLRIANPKSTFFSEKGWKDQEKKLADTVIRITAIQGEIADPVFIKTRSDAKVQAEKAIQEIKDKADKDEEDKLEQVLGEPDKFEEDEIKKNKESLMPDDVDRQWFFESLKEAGLDNFSTVLGLLTKQEELRKNSDPTFSQEGYDLAKEAVGIYFQEAGDLGMLFDIDQDLDSDFGKYAKALGVLPTDPREQMRGITLSEFRAFVRSNIASKPGEVESVESWEDIEGTGISKTQIAQFSGVRGEYVRRAYEQMRVSFNNLVKHKARLDLQTSLIRGKITQEDYDIKLRKIRGEMLVDRTNGEWNFGFEAGIRQELFKQAWEEQAKPLFHETEYGHIVLEGENSREIELAAEQAAEYITNTAGTYSLEAVQQRREYLIRAIVAKTPELEREAGSKSKTDELVNRIRQVALNKLDFFILEWLAITLRMPEWSSYFEQTVMQEGTDRLKKVPTMNDGLMGLAIWHWLKPEYRLYFNPQGFKNQLSSSAGQNYLRELLRGKLTETLMGYELKGEGSKAKTAILQKLMKVQSTEEFLTYFDEHNLDDVNSQHPKAKLDRAEAKYQAALKKAQSSPTPSPEDLLKLGEARAERTFEQRRFQTAEDRVKNAVTEAIKFMDLTGESARLGGPIIRMDNGDYIRVDDAKLFYKFAILQTDHGEQVDIAGKKYRVQDNESLIRWRSRMWIDAWKKAGLDRVKADVEYQKIVKRAYGKQTPPTFMLSLQEGFQETGLTPKEWLSFQAAVKEIKEKGITAEINKEKFEDIIKRPELQGLLSNYIADYKSSNNQLNDEYLRIQAFKGRVGTIKSLLAKLRLTEPVTGTPQQVTRVYTQRVEDSRSFDSEMEKLVYFEATHGLVKEIQQEQNDEGNWINIKDSKGQDLYAYPFSPDRIDYAHQGNSWGINRAQHRKAFDYTQLDRTTPRAVDLIHAIPLSLSSLSQESGSDDILNMFWDMNRMEKDDNWTLMTFAHRTKDAWFIGSKMDGGDVDIERGEGKQWTFLEKPLVDSNGLWKLIQGKVPGITLEKALEALFSNPDKYLGESGKEELVEEFMKILGRFRPIVNGAEKLFTNDRQALGSGAGFEENEKFGLRFLEWLISEKQGGGREQGGVAAYEEVVGIIKLITKPDGYRKGSSIWDEVWRKITPGHNPRLSSRPPTPTYEVVKFTP